jgi:hypothetical protein
LLKLIAKIRLWHVIAPHKQRSSGRQHIESLRYKGKEQKKKFVLIKGRKKEDGDEYPRELRCWMDGGGWFNGMSKSGSDGDFISYVRADRALELGTRTPDLVDGGWR